ncbi:MAG: pyridoxamine 5'-phosphate oxidase family protein [Thiomicrorhabdus sp.]|nr:pyridoxamine 5'-phosphate oxidase family protein [Thiomicrorhabdus sp.]
MTPQQQCKTLLQKRKSLMLSTRDSNGLIETSVTPFVYLEGVFYIYVSELAKHTQNCLWQIEHNQPQVSALITADEAETEQMFARERITLQLKLAKVMRNQNGYNTVLKQFAEEFGDIIELLSGLSDFHLFALTPISGGYVRGFGQAFAFENSPCLQLQPINKR